MIRNFPNWKFVCWWFMWTLASTAGAEGRTGNCRQPLLDGSSLPFSLHTRLSWEFSHALQENRDSIWDRWWEYINRSQILNVEIGNEAALFHFWGIYVKERKKQRNKKETKKDRLFSQHSTSWTFNWIFGTVWTDMIEKFTSSVQVIRRLWRE